MRNNFFNIYFNNFAQSWRSYLMQGLLFIFVGLVILFFPEILVVMIAMLFFITGIFIIFLGVQLKKEQNNPQKINLHFMD
jgi:uncharacterized membrane protein HdeD (DUF308 family)